MNINKYFILGLLLIVSSFNIATGLVALCLYMISTLRLTTVPRYKLITVLLCFKFVFILLIHVIFSQKSLFTLIQSLSSDILLLLILFIKLDSDDLRKFIFPLAGLFFIDLFFNLSLLIFGVDPLGRLSGLRPGDFTPRLHGVFGNPMFTIAISVAGIFIGFFLQKRWLMLLGFFAILINGTFRAPLTVILIVSFYILLKLRIRYSLLVTCSFVFAALVFTATIISAIQTGVLFTGASGFISGNELRVLAWTSSIEQIIASPWIGNHSFSTGEFTMSADAILEYGIAEAPWLQLALDYGVIVSALDFLIMFSLLKINIKRYYLDTSSHFNFIVALFTVVLVTERFYGVLYGTYFLTPIFLLCCVAAREKKHNPI